jgi:hypothetical protein
VPRRTVVPHLPDPLPTRGGEKKHDDPEAGARMMRAPLSTLPRLRGRVERGDVDGRDKPGHDSGEGFNMTGTHCRLHANGGLQKYRR